MVVGRQRERAARSLDCLLRQTAVSRIEILLADLAPDEARIDGGDHPAVRVLDASDQPGIGGAMARCVLAATAPCVAFIEDHCYAEPHWAAAIIRTER